MLSSYIMTLTTVYAHTSAILDTFYRYATK